MTLPDWFTAGAVKSFLILAGPSLAVSLALGIGGAIIQTTTQVRESALGFVPKVFGLVALIAFAGGMTMSVVGNYAHHVFMAIPSIVHVGLHH